MANHPKPIHGVRSNSQKGGNRSGYAKTEELVKANNNIVYASGVRFRAKTSSGALVKQGV